MTTSSLDATLAQLEAMVVTDPAGAVELAKATLIRAADALIGDQLRLRRLLAMAFSHTNQLDKALETCDAALALPGASDAPVEAARVRLASMQPLAMLDRVDEAITAGEDALVVLEHESNAALAGRAALNLGSLHAMTGHPGEALPWFDRARTQLDDNPVLLGQIESNRGTALAALDRFEEAETAFARAVELLDADEMPWAAAIAEESLADLLARQGAYNRSLRHIERARRNFERDEAWGDLGRLNAEEATVLAHMGLTEIARDAFDTALTQLDEHGAPVDHAMALVACGLAMVDGGAPDAAGDMLGRATALVDASGNAELERQLTLLRGRIALTNGDATAARESIATGLAQTEGLPVQQLRWRLMEASSATLDGDHDAARSRLSDALDTASATHVLPLVAQIHQMLAELTRASGDDDLANTHARAAIEAWERIRATIQADRLRQSWHQGRLDTYESLYLSLVERADSTSQREAFGVAEQIRGRILLDAMHVSASDLEQTEPISESAEPLLAELDDHRRWLNWMYSALADGREPTPAQLRELNEREWSAATLQDRIDTLRPPSGFTTPTELDHVQAKLDASTVILSYLVAGDHITAQVITADTIHGVATLAPTPDVADLVARLQFQFGRALVHGVQPVSAARQARLRRDTDAILEQLHAVLIVPVAPWLEGRERVVVVPSGSLHSVPFAALRSEAGYLVDQHHIVTAPGISVLEMLRQRADTAPVPAVRPLVVAVPDESTPGLDVEARSVAARLNGSRLLLGDDANRAAILEAMPDAGLIHVALHGRFDEGHPAASGLRAADGWITLDALAGLLLENSPLVLLTGCETGRARVGHGDDLEGLMAAMIAAGARGLVTSLWQTHDTAATELTAALYDALERGLAPAAALRESQRAIRAQYPHPALWAPFVATHATPKGDQA